MAFLISDEIEKPASVASVVTTTAPEYKATPKLLTLAELPLPRVVKKKTNLEYQPEKPAINASPSKKHNTHDTVPIYVPAPTALSIGADVDETSQGSSGPLDLENCTDELNELTDIIDDDDGCLLEDKDTLQATNSEEKTPEATNKTEKSANSSDGLEKKSAKSEKSDKEHKRRDSTSSVSHSRQKHHKSSSSRSKGDDKRKERSRDKEKEEKKEPKSSSSSSRHKSSSTHKSSSRDKESKDSKHKSSSSDRKHHSSSSSSTSASKHKSNSSSRSTTSSSSLKNATSSSPSRSDKQSKSKSKERALIDKKSDIDTSNLFATSEEDIMKECEMIYDQLEQEFASLHQQSNGSEEEQKAKDDKKKAAAKRKAQEDEELAEASSKKRVAYENADKHKSQHMLPTVLKADHRNNAMKVRNQNYQKIQIS